MTVGYATCSPEKKRTKGCEEAISAKRVLLYSSCLLNEHIFRCNLKKFDLSTYSYDVLAELQVASMLQGFTKW